MVSKFVRYCVLVQEDAYITFSINSCVNLTLHSTKNNKQCTTSKVWKVTVTHEQFSRTILLQMCYGRKRSRKSGKIVFLPNGFKFDIATQTNE